MGRPVSALRHTIEGPRNLVNKTRPDFLESLQCRLVPATLRPGSVRYRKKETVNKTELVRAAAAEARTTIDAADAVITAVLWVIQREVAAGRNVSITGFGVFEQHQRPEREGRNPATGAALRLPAARVPRFRAGKLFRDRVNR
jgi:DNA-binding protein HU-beta